VFPFLTPIMFPFPMPITTSLNWVSDIIHDPIAGVFAAGLNRLADIIHDPVASVFAAGLNGL